MSAHYIGKHIGNRSFPSNKGAQAFYDIRTWRKLLDTQGGENISDGFLPHGQFADFLHGIALCHRSLLSHFSISNRDYLMARP
jgi:hypothetical protein